MSINPYKPKLIFTGEPFAGRVCELTSEKITVGRGDHNALAIHHPSVSQTHCEILVNGPEVIVRDLHSSNGTFVEGVRILPQSQVKHGQAIWFGDVAARLELAPPFSEETTTTDQTAVHEHLKIAREQQQEKLAPKSADVSMKLDPGSGTGATPGEPTVMLNATSLVAIPPATSRPVVQEIPRATSHGKLRVIVVLAATGLIGLLCWWLRSK